jgi:hypothetical protein
VTAPLYATTEELKDRLGITDTSRDFALERCLDGACRWIERTLDRRFYTTGESEVRYYSAYNWYWQVQVDDLLSVDEVATDNNNDGVYETIWTLGTDFWLGPKNALARGEPYDTLNRTWPTGRVSFPGWVNSVRVTSTTFGYCALTNCPPGIRELALSIAETMAGPTMDFTMSGVQSYRIGTELSVTMATKNLPPLSLNTLDQFRKGGGYVY